MTENECPEKWIKLAATISDQFPESIEDATAELMSTIVDDPEYDQWSAMIRRRFCQGLIYDARHKSNVELKRQSGQYGGPGRVSMASESVNQTCISVFQHYIAGRTLGSLLGKELAGIANSESEIAAGHQFNAALLRWLEGKVPAEKRVADAVSEKALTKVYRNLQKQVAAGREEEAAVA